MTRNDSISPQEEPTGCGGEGETGATGSGVDVIGASVGINGASVGVKGAGVGVKGAGVGVKGADVGVKGDLVGSEAVGDGVGGTEPGQPQLVSTASSLLKMWSSSSHTHWLTAVG